MTERLAVNGVELAYSTYGAGNEGPTLLLCHGFTGAASDWDGVVETLAQDGPVVTYDHRGHGHSTNTGDRATYRIEQLVDDLAAVVDTLALDRFDLLGHSMGGMVAMRYALRRPEQLRSLILMDTAARPAPALAAYLKPAIGKVREGGASALAELAQLRPEGPDRRKLEQMDPVAFEVLGTALADSASVLDDLRTLRIATTVIVGQDDTAFVTASHDLAGAIPGSVLEVIPGAAHSPQVENRDAWLAAVRGHLARLTAGG